MKMKKWLVLTLAAVLGFSLTACATTTTTDESPYKNYDYILKFEEMWNRPVESGDYLVYLYAPSSESCVSLEEVVFAYADADDSPYPIYFMDVSTQPEDTQTQFLDIIGITKLTYPVVVLVQDKGFDSTAQSRYYYAGLTRIRSLFYDLNNGIDPFND